VELAFWEMSCILEENEKKREKGRKEEEDLFGEERICLCMLM
jgi:hypothetical protein